MDAPDSGDARHPWICFIAHFHPSSVYYIYATVIAEQFGYGFGFAAFMMYLIYVADGESKPHITLLLLDLWH
jgi:hypothetical protein